MIKLIATDMDGTLLNSEHKISEENKKYIINAQEKGVKFVLASGRPTYAMIPFIKELQMDKYGGYIISYNGAEIMEASTLKTIYSKFLNLDTVKEMYEVAKQNNVSLITYDKDIIYIYDINEYSLVEPKITNLEYREIKLIDELKNNEYPKCMLVSSNDKVALLEKKLKEIYNNKLYIAKSSPIFIEIANKEIDKGKSLEKLLEILNIDKNSAIAAGDNYNDIALLKAVGIPVAVSNAVDEIKKIAKYISTSNECDALANIIKEYVVK